MEFQNKINTIKCFKLAVNQFVKFGVKLNHFLIVLTLEFIIYFLAELILCYR